MRIMYDTFKDCSLDMTARLQRTLLLVIAVSLGVGTFVTSLGSNITASRQISNTMAAGMLDQISVGVAGEPLGITFPDDAEARALSLSMVKAAGRRIEVELGIALPNRFARSDETYVEGISVLGVTSGFLDVVEVEGGVDGSWILDSSDHTNAVYLGVTAAEILGIPTDSLYPQGYQIYINGKHMDVVGIISSSQRADINSAVLIPYRHAVELQKGTDRDASLVARTEVGAGGPVSTVLRQAIRPDAYERLGVTQVATLDSMRSGVDNQMARLGMSIGVMLLALTTLLIANSMIVAVMSRTAEIGLRRALGSSKTDIARLFLTEGAITGALGGLAGAAFGVCGNLVIALINGWSVTMPLWLPFAGLGVGIAVGVGASVYPALSAARINPATAIRVD